MYAAWSPAGRLRINGRSPALPAHILSQLGGISVPKRSAQRLHSPGCLQWCLCTSIDNTSPL